MKIETHLRNIKKKGNVCVYIKHIARESNKYAVKRFTFKECLIHFIYIKC